MSTNTPIASQTLSSAASSVTFSNIPQGYTDLIIVGNLGAATTSYVGARFNSDTGSNYSVTNLSGNGTTATSNRASSRSIADLSYEVTNSSAIQANFITQIMNYSNSTTFKTVLTRTNNAGIGTSATVVLWRSTSAITSIELYTSTGGGANLYNFTAGSTFSIYGIAGGGFTAKAAGGVVTTDATYAYHTFTTSGGFTPYQALTVDYLVVAGGGGAGEDNSGGGGAGGLRCTVGATGGGGTVETPLSLTANYNYPVVIGAGGAGSTSGGGVSGTSGNNSVFSTITSTGGGGGGGDTSGYRLGLTGGSGGGGTGNNASPQVYAGGAGTANQGFAGGTGYGSGGGGWQNNRGGGGGGAGAAGVAGNVTSTGGNGGNGVATSISGSSVTYAGGGAGGTQGATAAIGGTGGGGTPGGTGNAGNPGGAGTVNLGGGGAGGGGSGGDGGSGGSGIVIIRYAL